MALFENYEDTGYSWTTFTDASDTWAYQTFQDVKKQTIDSVALYLKKVGNGANVIVSIRATTGVSGSKEPIGSNLCVSNAVDCTGISTVGEWVTFTFTSTYNLEKNTEYAILARCDGDGGNNVPWATMGTGAYASGNRGYTNDSGSSWIAQSAADSLFRAYGTEITTLTDKTFSKKLVSFGNDEIWYESSAGTMAELTAANNDIDCTTPLTAIEAFEKIFIANGTNLKVADFGNTKITTASIGTHPPDNATVLTGGTSGAEMVVDYITALTGACTIYGKRITTATFISGETVTGTDDDGNSISFSTNAAETAPPHWYDWTVYGNSSTFGAMPEQANKVFLYQGRVGLTCDKDYPHQWYLSRQGNPWDWNYISDDTQSPVAGEDAEAGQAGDIVVTAIPYSNDYLIFACANSFQYLVGNPAEGGTMLDLDNGAGILGVRAFCWDNKGNLYILATTGLLRIPKGFGIAENLTEASYPDFIKDLAYNASTHRIVMGYDRQRHGIIVAKTTLATGANSGWWYDLKTEGLFPEDFDDTGCGIFSIFHYEAVNPTYNKLLFGCNDGYIRFADPDSTSDIKSDDTSQAIDSYFTIGPIKLGAENQEGKINSVVGVTAGGQSGGTDSDDVTYKLWTGLSADEVVEKLIANTSPNAAGTIKAPGRWRGNQKRQRVRGMFAGIRVGNNTADETWSLERLIVGISQGGRMK